MRGGFSINGKLQYKLIKEEEEERKKKKTIDDIAIPIYIIGIKLMEWYVVMLCYFP